MQRTRMASVITIGMTAALWLPIFALAEQPEQRSALRQLFVMWFPLLLFIGFWMFFMRWSGYGKLQKRSMEHMDALERKVDRVIELLEEHQPSGE